MSESKQPFGQPDVVHFSDEDAGAKVREGASSGLWDTVSLIRAQRDDWLRAQAAAAE